MKTKQPFRPENMSASFSDAELADRMLTDVIARTAIDLARQAGEEVRRPLSRDQLARAFEVNTKEFALVRTFLLERWERKYNDGNLGDRYYEEPKSTE